MKTTPKENAMKRTLKRIRIWLGLEEPNWWDREDAGPVETIQGPRLAAALRHREALA